MNYTCRFATIDDVRLIDNFWSNFAFVRKNDIIGYIPTTIVLLDKDKKEVGVFVMNKKKNKILLMIIRKKLRGQGVGTFFYNRSLEMLKPNIEEVTLKCMSKLSDSIKFWESMGFEVYDTSTTRVGNLLSSMRYKEVKRDE